METPVTAIIADDEPLLRFHLNQALAEIWPTLDIVAQAANGSQALTAIEQHQPDIAFLDIKMPQLDGMTLAHRLQTQPCVPLVVFITAYDEFAVRAFEENAVDYLLKPVSEARLQQCCQRLQARIARNRSTSHHAQPQELSLLWDKLQGMLEKPTYLTWLRASKGEDIHLIAVADVLYFRASDKYISVFRAGLQGLEEYLLRISLRELLAQLDPAQFWQIHRAVVVNVAQIDKVKKDLTGRMFVHIGEQKLPVSRAQQGLFK